MAVKHQENEKFRYFCIKIGCMDRLATVCCCAPITIFKPLLILFSVPPEEIKKMDNVHMVETPEQVKSALQHSHWDGESFLAIGGNHYRICAPVASDDRMSSVILWTKNNAEDTVRTWEKVVSNNIFINANHLSLTPA